MKTLKRNWLLDIFFPLDENQDWVVSIWAILALAVIGYIVTLTDVIMFFIWIPIMVFSLIWLFNGQAYKLWYFVAVSPGLEMLTRLSRNRIIPYECGKYLGFYLMLAIAFSRLDSRNVVARPKYNLGLLLLICFLPSLLYCMAIFGFDLQKWVFNIFSLLELSVLSMFLSRQRWTEKEYVNMIKIASIPTIPIVTYLTIKTPKFDDISFSGAAITDTTGGFGSNQISTILGFGLFLVVILLVIGKPLFKYRILSIALAIYLIFRCLITFSRGGLVVAVLALFVTLLVYMFKDPKTFRKNFVYILFLAIFCAGTFVFVNSLTSDMLVNRYVGRTANAQKYENENTLNKITSNRSDISMTDIYIFMDNIFFGVGPGNSRDYRERYGGFNIIPHTEYTRLLSENGIGGLFVAIGLTIFPFFWLRQIKSIEVRALSLGLFILSIGTSFHAATRTNVVMVCYLLACMPIVDTKLKT